MIVEVVLPALGRNVESAKVVSVLVAAGATVARDQALIEVETGKAVAEIPSTAAGTVDQLLVAVGNTLKPGQALVRIEAADAPAPADAAPAAPAAAPAAPAAAPAPAAPPPTPTAAATAAPVQAAPAVAPDAAVRRHVPAAPSVRRFARELGLDVDNVRGSGPHGRVAIDDVKRHARDRLAAVAGGSALPPLPDFGAWGPVHTEAMSAIRQATAAQVTRCWTAIPRVTHFDTADITQLETLRARYAERASALGGKLTLAVMVVKVCALALRRFPRFNASVNVAGRRIIYKDYVHLGIAVATPRGLLVPVIRDADRKNLVELAAEITRVAAACREGKVTPEQLEGATFTVTNLGRIGGGHFTPIVNWPEVAILGMGRTTERVVLRNQTVEARIELPLSLSYDHRLIDGADAAAFTRWVAEAIEEPLVLALEG